MGQWSRNWTTALLSLPNLQRARTWTLSTLFTLRNESLAETDIDADNCGTQAVNGGIKNWGGKFSVPKQSVLLSPADVTSVHLRLRFNPTGKKWSWTLTDEQLLRDFFTYVQVCRGQD